MKTPEKQLRTLQLNRGLKTKDITACLQMSHPTYISRLRNPLKFTGVDRKRLARLFKVDISIIDRVINGGHYNK